MRNDTIVFLLCYIFKWNLILRKYRTRQRLFPSACCLIKPLFYFFSTHWFFNGYFHVILGKIRILIQTCFISNVPAESIMCTLKRTYRPVYRQNTSIPWSSLRQLYFIYFGSFVLYLTLVFDQHFRWNLTRIIINVKNLFLLPHRHQILPLNSKYVQSMRIL